METIKLYLHVLTDTRSGLESENNCSSSNDIDKASGSCSCIINSRLSLGDLK